jgi:hypothetical protein
MSNWFHYYDTKSLRQPSAATTEASLLREESLTIYRASSTTSPIYRYYRSDCTREEIDLHPVPPAALRQSSNATTEASLLRRMITYRIGLVGLVGLRCGRSVGTVHGHIRRTLHLPGPRNLEGRGLHKVWNREDGVHSRSSGLCFNLASGQVGKFSPMSFYLDLVD